MPADARPGLIDRVNTAYRAFRAKKSGGSFAPMDVTWTQGYGMPALFKPKESLAAYGDNVHLYRSVLTIAMEMARTPIKR